MNVFAKLTILLVISLSFAQDNITIKGDVFMDYMYSKNHAGSETDKNGLLFRRIYLSLNKTFDDKLGAKAQLEMSSSDFKSASTKMTPTVKDLYLSWALSSNHLLVAGIQGNTTVTRLEKFYGLRYVEKTPADLFKHESTRETGISVNGRLANELFYHVLFGNGEGNSSENNRGVYVSSSLAFQSEHVLAEVNGHFNSDRKGANVFERTVNAVFGYRNSSFRATASAHYMEQEDKDLNVLTGKSTVLSGFVYVTVTENSGLFLRVDKPIDGTSANPDYYALSANEEFTLFLFGYTSSLHKMITFSPNIAFVDYNTSTESDLIAKMTVNFKF
jgi:hypothetical protein